jgi:CRP-like cAMP-binding protein
MSTKQDPLLVRTVVNPPAPVVTSSSMPGPLLPGSRTDETGKAIHNILLLLISDLEFTLLRPHLDFVDLPQGYILHEPGEKIEFAYFLNSGMTSLVVSTSEGRSCEIGIVGKEGMVGAPIAVGLRQAPYRALMQIAGYGLRIRADVLADLLPDSAKLKEQLLRYVFLQGFQVAQAAACNRLHEIEQRLARWLLMCQDRVDSEVLMLTHEFLANMLGTGRPTVTLATGVLQRAGLIENMRGTVRIINRKSLEAAACECYGVIQNYNGGLGLK